MQLRKPYTDDKNKKSELTGLVCEEPTRAQQQFKEECDINTILKRFGVTGHLPLTTKQPLAGDFTEIDDYQSAVEAVRAAQQNFMTLPASTRSKFHNDPQQFVDFCINPANIDAVRDLGLAPKLQEIPNESEKPNP
nr:MAG: internal scaffolding protein [Microvirus sp.]